MLKIRLKWKCHKKHTYRNIKLIININNVLSFNFDQFCQILKLTTQGWFSLTKIY